MKRMKKQDGFLLTVTAYITPSCSQILSQVSVASGDSEPVDAIAVWDTGAESCGISKKMAERLGLKPLGWKKRIRYADGTVRDENVYVVSFIFPPNGYKATLYAFEFGDAAQDVLIGMDIIRNGRFLIEPIGDGSARFTYTYG